MKKQDGFGHEKPFEGETNDWITPQWIIEAFDSKAGEKGMFFDLDPCISTSQPWLTARNGYSIEQDGLRYPWHGTMWCNPPYGNNVGIWAKRMAEHGNGIMLIFARVETTTWQDIIFPTGDAFLFPKRRINFYEFVCECGKPRSWHSGSCKKKYEQTCKNYQQTMQTVEGESAGAPSAFIAWGKVCAHVLWELEAENKIPGTYFGRSNNYIPEYHREAYFRTVK